jgi:hypothetical protein
MQSTPVFSLRIGDHPTLDGWTTRMERTVGGWRTSRTSNSWSPVLPMGLFVFASQAPSWLEFGTVMGRQQMDRLCAPASRWSCRTGMDAGIPLRQARSARVTN